LEFQANPDVTLQLTKFAWTRAFSPVIRLSAVDLYHRDGSAGRLMRGWMRWRGSAEGAQDGGAGDGGGPSTEWIWGGRWIFVNAELTAGFFRDGGQ